MKKITHQILKYQQISQLNEYTIKLLWTKWCSLSKTDPLTLPNWHNQTEIK